MFICVYIPSRASGVRRRRRPRLESFLRHSFFSLPSSINKKDFLRNRKKKISFLPGLFGNLTDYEKDMPRGVISSTIKRKPHERKRIILKDFNGAGERLLTHHRRSMMTTSLLLLRHSSSSALFFSSSSSLVFTENTNSPRSFASIKVRFF